MQYEEFDKQKDNVELDNEEKLIKTIMDTCKLLYPEVYYIGKGINSKKAIVVRKKLGDISESSDRYMLKDDKVAVFNDVVNFRNRNANFLFIWTNKYGKKIIEIYNRYTLEKVYGNGIFRDKSCRQLGKKLLYYFVSDLYNSMCIQLNNETGELIASNPVN